MDSLYLLVDLMTYVLQLRGSKPCFFVCVSFLNCVCLWREMENMLGKICHAGCVEVNDQLFGVDSSLSCWWLAYPRQLVESLHSSMSG